MYCFSDFAERFLYVFICEDELVFRADLRLVVQIWNIFWSFQKFCAQLHSREHSFNITMKNYVDL